MRYSVSDVCYAIAVVMFLASFPAVVWMIWSDGGAASKTVATVLATAIFFGLVGRMTSDV